MSMGRNSLWLAAGAFALTSGAAFAQDAADAIEAEARLQTVVVTGVVKAGGQNRLDFTVIGPAVNLAARIEGLAGELGRRILVSSEFVAIHGGAFDHVGEFALKGLSGERAVFAPGS